MNLTAEDRSELEAALALLVDSKVPIDMPCIERALLIVMRVLLKSG